MASLDLTLRGGSCKVGLDDSDYAAENNVSLVKLWMEKSELAKKLLISCGLLLLWC